MTREEKCKIMIKQGFTYDSVSGNVYGKQQQLINTNSRGYIVISFKYMKKHYTIKGHQFGYYYINNIIVDYIDHINGIKNDNRLCNLRSVTNQENTFNNKAKGYCWDKSRNKFSAQIKLNGKKIHLGRFDNEEDASNAYKEAKKIYHIIN